ncbi:MAG: glycosyltransferase [Candidatus Portnoybacteria bacterium]|nr:glycosyltransferase [Candidatus Portnoybacteria bacterium]
MTIQSDRDLKDYEKIAGQEIVENIRKKSKKLSGKHMVCVSSTHEGGGVAEMLNSLIVLFNKMGIRFGWRILHGTPDFFTVTKKFHNALQGEDIHFSDKKKKLYYETNKRYALFNHIDHDLVVVHDPQPLPLINFYEKKQPWVFRCHVDLSNPDQDLWSYLKKYIEKYDEMIVSTEEYKKNLKISQSIIHPAIDPLTVKNNEISKDVMEEYLGKNGISLKKPIISQISRYDKWKDPEGVIKVFEKVKKEVDCQLVLLGNMVTDDPESVKIYSKTIKKYGDREDIKILVNVSANDLVVNALQRKSSVVIQKSIREGFGLTISEALYKGTPVVASDVGGIPLQVKDGESGFLHFPDDIDGFANSVIKILKDDSLRERLGENGREYVKKNFLITRLMMDWLNVFEKRLL